MTFAATANAVAYTGATPVFCDVSADDLLIDPHAVEKLITPSTRAVFAVDYAGQPCDWDALAAIADEHDLALVDDACHALGATYHGKSMGTLADMTVYSFHPVKHITTGEGGAVVTDDGDLATRLKTLRNHGITADFRQREKQGSAYYEIDELGHNYRITDFQCALGSSQLKRLDSWLSRRREIAARYDAAFAADDRVRPLAVAPDVEHAYHLYVIELAESIDRDRVFSEMREEGVGVNVHYVPAHLHPYYRRELGTQEGDCPVTERAHTRILSLPMYPGLTDDDVDTVVGKLASVLDQHG
jgi:perosamine synthetase